jgi:hypothetical protein
MNTAISKLYVTTYSVCLICYSALVIIAKILIKILVKNVTHPGSDEKNNYILVENFIYVIITLVKKV